jgi:hypothetical protein
VKLSKYINDILTWRNKLYEELVNKLRYPQYEGEAYFASELIGSDEESVEEEAEDESGLDQWFDGRT